MAVIDYSPQLLLFSTPLLHSQTESQETHLLMRSRLMAIDKAKDCEKNYKRDFIECKETSLLSSLNAYNPFAELCNLL